MDNYTNAVNDVFDSVVKSVGIHVTLLITERALWLTKHKYEEAALINFSEDGIDLAKLQEIDPERAKLIILSLIKNISTTLSQLVGKQLAFQLTEQFQTMFGQEVNDG